MPECGVRVKNRQVPQHGRLEYKSTRTDGSRELGRRMAAMMSNAKKDGYMMVRHVGVEVKVVVIRGCINGGSLEHLCPCW